MQFIFHFDLKDAEWMYSEICVIYMYVWFFEMTSELKVSFVSSLIVNCRENNMFRCRENNMFRFIFTVQKKRRENRDAD